jgi:hypothetical protein
MAGTPSLLIRKVDIWAANIFNLKLILAIATSGRGTIKTINKIANQICLKNAFPKNNKTRPIKTRIKENPEEKYILQSALMVCMDIPDIKNNQPHFEGLIFILLKLSFFSQMRKILIKGTKNPWL